MSGNSAALGMLDGGEPRLGTATVIRANSRALPLADNSVDLVVTSPPYFALRSYQDGGEHYAGQIGDEPTPDEFVSSLLEVTRECMRVLKPSGSLWVNLGDKYAQAEERSRNGNGNRTHGENFASGSVLRGPTVTLGRKENGVPRKSLIGIPWRYALRCIDDLGLILRAEVIWSKPNGLPESVKDRVRRSHEQWFHFTLEPRYFSAVDEIREATTPRKGEMSWSERKAAGEPARRGEQGANDATVNGMASNPLGKLPGSVWTIATEPLKVPDELGVDHFAAFPTEWPRRIIAGWSPSGVCTACGEGRAPIRASEKVTSRPGFNVQDQRMPGRHASGNQGREGRAGDFLVSISGYACACPEPTWETSPDSGVCVTCDMSSDWADSCSNGCEPPSRAPTTPAVVLDPFGGTGTTAMVAKALGRDGISVDMSADYCRLAQWRTNDRDQLAKVLGVAKAEQQPADQLDLFGESA